MMARPLIMAVAAGGVAASVAGGLVLLHRGEGVSDEICLRSDLIFIEEAVRGCYGRDEIAELQNKTVRDDQGSPVAARLTHPSDMERGLETVTTCTEYNALSRDSWYAMTAREERREAFFRRACGVLDMLASARPAETSHFTDDRVTEADIRSLAAGPPFRFIEAGEDETGEPVESREIRPGIWRLRAEAQSATLQEIAIADFIGDGLGEVLVYITIRIDEATATTGMLGLLAKPSADGPVRFIERPERSREST